MTDFPGPAAPEVRELILEIRDAMVAMYGIAPDEAEARLRDDFRREDLTDETLALVLGHETPERWAELAYFGNVEAQKPPDERRPLPWPPVDP